MLPLCDGTPLSRQAANTAAVVLQLVQRGGAVRHLIGEGGWQGTMKPGGSWRFGRTQRRINIDVFLAPDSHRGP